MAEKTRAELESVFETDDIPTETNFSEFIESCANRKDDYKESATDPTVTNDANSGYKKFDIILNTVKNIFYFCVSNTVGSAVWKGFMNIVSSPTNGNLVSMDANGNSVNSSISKDNVVTSSSNLTTDEIILGASADKTIKKSGKTFEDVPTNSVIKITTSQWLYNVSGQSSDWLKSVSNNTNQNVSSPTDNLFYNLMSISLSAGTWEIEFFVCGQFNSDANSVYVIFFVGLATTPEGTPASDFSCVAGNTLGANSVYNPIFQRKIIVTLGSTTEYYMVMKSQKISGTGNIVYLASRGDYAPAKIMARRLY